MVDAHSHVMTPWTMDNEIVLHSMGNWACTHLVTSWTNLLLMSVGASSTVWYHNAFIVGNYLVANRDTGSTLVLDRQNTGIMTLCLCRGCEVADYPREVWKNSAFQKPYSKHWSGGCQDCLTYILPPLTKGTQLHTHWFHCASIDSITKLHFWI